MGFRPAFRDLPDEVVAEAGSVLADYLGECLFVGATKPWGRSVAEFAVAYGGAQPEATIIASGRKTLASRAALANGTMALGFEYADFGAGSRPYPFAVTGPLVLAEAEKRSGADLVVAIAIGYEVMARTTRAMLPKGLTTPFYVPALYGTLGSSAGCARVLGLDAIQTTAALGLGAAFTGGTFQGHEEGSWQRSLNGGMASERGVTAAQLARTGFKATALGLEGVQGFFRDVLRRTAGTGFATGRSGRVVRHHRQVGEGLPDERDTARAGRSAVVDHGREQPAPHRHRGH